MQRLDMYSDNYRNVPIIMPPNEEDSNRTKKKNERRLASLEKAMEKKNKKHKLMMEKALAAGRPLPPKPASNRPRKYKKREKKPEGEAKPKKERKKREKSSNPVGRPKKNKTGDVKVKDPRLPKRPQNPFFQFCQEQRNRVQKEYLRQNDVNLSKKELTKILAQKWHEMGAEQKQIYNLLFEEEKKLYAENMSKYREESKKSLLLRTPPPVSAAGPSSSSLPETPIQPSGVSLPLPSGEQFRQPPKPGATIPHLG